VLELRSWWGGEILGDIFGDDFTWWRYARVLEIISLNTPSQVGAWRFAMPNLDERDKKRSRPSALVKISAS
jgi:hypothetical protein